MVILTTNDALEAERVLCARSFAYFIRRAWPHIIPDQYQHNWHIDAIAEHLEAVNAGEITRLLVNVPPGSSKSTIIGIMYPAWLWGPAKKPGTRYIGAAHEQGLAVRDNRIMRELVRSEWYQRLWPLALQGDQNEKLYFENEHRGFRQACAVRSMTGRRGHCLDGDTLIATDDGEKTIRSIAESAASCNVISYDIHSKRLVQRSVRAVARGSSSQIYRVHFASGRVVVCSGDHRFYTGRGYVEARVLSIGDTCVRLLREDVRQDDSGRQEVTRQKRDDLLQPVLLDDCGEYQAWKDWSVLQRLREEDPQGSTSVLSGVQEIGQGSRWLEAARSAGGNTVPDVLDGVLRSGFEQSSVLLERLRIGASSVSHFGAEQPGVAGRCGCAAQEASRWIATGVDQDSDENCGARPWEVRGLRVNHAASCPSHRLAAHEQCAGESGNALREMSLQAAWRGEVEAVSDVVAVVERLRDPRDTYDIQVDDTHCFFANGILVHNCVAWDDPLSPEKAHSDAGRDEAIRVLSETVPTRLNDPKTSSIIVVMQRLHEQDPSGHIIANDLGYDHLCIPMEYDPSRAKATSIGWTDPRKDEGELMFPDRFPAEVIARDKAAMGAYAWAGQMQQRPTPAGGGVFKDDWWRYYTSLPPLDWRMIYADTAQKTGQDNDFSVFECWGRSHTGQAYLLDMIRGKWEAPELLVQARAFWHKHSMSPGTGQLRAMKVEDKVSGTGLIQTLRREGIPVQPIQRHNDKLTRAYDAAPFVESGNVYLPQDADFLSAFLQEASAFPNGAHDDQLDPMFDAVKEVQFLPAERKRVATAVPSMAMPMSSR